MTVDAYSDHGVALNHPLRQMVTESIVNCYDSTTWKIVHNHVKTDSTANTYARAPGMRDISLYLLIEKLEIF